MITIVKRPQIFTPASNPVIWQVQSDNNNLVYFKVELLDAATNGVISSLNIYPTPVYPNGSYIDLSKFLENTVKYELKVNNNLLEPVKKPVRDYRLQITEWNYNSTSGLIETGDSYNDTSDINFVWDAEIERNKFLSFQHDDYVVKASNVASFLTNRPNGANVNDVSTEYLYFIQNIAGTIVYTNPYSISAVETTYYEPVDDRWYFRLTVNFSGLPSTVTSIKLYWKVPSSSTWMGNQTFSTTSPIVYDVLDSGVYKMELYAGSTLVDTIDPQNPSVASTVFDDYYSIVTLYDASGTILSNRSDLIPLSVSDKMYRLNISPKALQTQYSISFTGVVYYTVGIQDFNGDDVINPITYYYQKVECNKEYVNLLWTNSLGGVDSYQFHSPVETINLNRFNIKKGIYGLDSNGYYTDNKDNIFNPSEETINNKASGQRRVTSEPLNDAQAYWMAELFRSKNVWMEMSNGMLAPVMLTATSYQVPRLRLSKGNLNVITVDFNLTDGLL